MKNQLTQMTFVIDFRFRLVDPLLSIVKLPSDMPEKKINKKNIICFDMI